MAVKRFPGHNLHVEVTVLRTLSAISFFPSDNFLYIFKKLKRTIRTIFLCNKKYRSPCLFKRKGAFISRSSLLRGKILTFCRSTRSCARANHANIVRSRDAQCKTKESPQNLLSSSRCECGLAHFSALPNSLPRQYAGEAIPYNKDRGACPTFWGLKKGFSYLLGCSTSKRLTGGSFAVLFKTF